MPSGYPPSVFISSTCFDLSQIRLDLNDFIQGLGYVPVISESRGFPVNPQADNVENCIQAVRDRADLFVIVVGSRYGTESHGRSITNHEYLEAKQKGVPIFVFVTHNILSNLSLWQANPDADFSSVVDSVKLFEFIQTLRGSEGHWVFSFNNATDIIETLRSQWALLFTDALGERDRLRKAKLSRELMDLPASCLRVLLEKPRSWEYRFFSAVLKSQIDQRSALKRNVQYGLQLGAVTHANEFSEVSKWLSSRRMEILMLIKSADRLLSTPLKDALGPFGEPGDPELLAYVARRIGDIYERLLLWTHDFSSVATEPELERLVQLHSFMSSIVIESLESFPNLIDTEISQAIEAVSKGEVYSGSVVLNLNIPSVDEIIVEIERIGANGLNH